MQADVDAVALQRRQRLATGPPSRGSDQATQGAHAAQPRELQRRTVDPRVQANVVDADGDAALRVARVKQANEGARVGWFIFVGCVAAALHFGVVVLLVTQAGLPPLLANVGGWLLAFGVSFAGHHHFSFPQHGAPVLAAAERFFAISATGFALNELAYAALLQWSGLRYELGLALVLLAVAVATYWASRHWAFLRSPAR